MRNKKPMKSANQVGENQVLVKIFNGHYILAGSFYMLSTILSNLNHTQLNWDIPIDNPFLNMSKLRHREVNKLAPSSHNSLGVAENVPSF